MSNVEDEIQAVLNKAGIKYEVHEHEPVYTCPKMAEYLGTDQNLIAKSMIMKTSSDQCFLAVLPGRLKIDYTLLATVLKVKSVSFAPIGEAEKIAKCSVGCVYPLGNMMRLATYFDSRLLENEYVYFNPGSHTKSIRISTRDLVDLVKPQIGNFTRTE